MKSLGFTLVALLSLASCLEERPAQPEQNAIINNLPVNDRELLLGPLEGAFDDLKNNIEQSESYFASSSDWSRNNQSGKLDFKLDGSDTAMSRVRIRNGQVETERHEWCFDENGHLFYSEHFFDTPSFGLNQGATKRHYKFYFEENNVVLSTYARMAFDGNSAPEVWTPVCLTTEEQSFIQGRLNFARRQTRKTE
jgi:hypothetical protein